MSDTPPTATPPARRPPPAIPGPVDTAVAFWRWLRRMRTALYLLGVLAAATLLATIVPQRPNVPDTVTAWLTGTEGPGEVPARLLDALGAFDVFGATWFMALLALLFTSLTSCLVVRYRAFQRLAVHGRPPRTRSLDGQPHVARFASTTPPDRALAVAAQVLRRRRYRVRRADADADARHHRTPDDGQPLRRRLGRGLLRQLPDGQAAVRAR
ncbi:MAG TPA: cytochrome c biogenesis protein ResB, partial [Nitriliruptorales bacterium]|nr:cytochrome c biogenesis protein ResB [Nitriliruptorales bacterium]